MKRGKGILDRLNYADAWSEAPLGEQTLLELLDDRRILIEHHDGVTEYTCTQIRVKVAYGCLCISGTGLKLSKMSAEQLVITGCISAVTLIKER